VATIFLFNPKSRIQNSKSKNSSLLSTQSTFFLFSLFFTPPSDSPDGAEKLCSIQKRFILKCIKSGRAARLSVPVKQGEIL
jgi:hypothetical protein